MEMVISATHKTIGHQARAATWTDKGRLQKIKVKRKPCNRRSIFLVKRKTYSRHRKILVKGKTYSRRSRTLNYQSIGISKVDINHKPQDPDALSGYQNDIKLKSGGSQRRTPQTEGRASFRLNLFEFYSISIILFNSFPTYGHCASFSLLT